MPTEQDNIHKNNVFKLQFRNHVYFFRADSEFSFARWDSTAYAEILCWPFGHVIVIVVVVVLVVVVVIAPTLLTSELQHIEPG